MSKKNTKKNENDVVLAAKQKSKFFEEYYANLQTIQDKLTIEEINIMAKALEVATIQAKEREDEKHREEIAAKERAVKEAERKKREREEKRRAAKLAREEAIKHREHVKSVTCMDLPLDFSNAFEGNNEICEHVESVADGLIASLDNLGAVDIEYISEVTGIDMKDIIKDMGLDDKTFPAKYVLSVISREKDKMISPDMLLERAETLLELEKVFW